MYVLEHKEIPFSRMEEIKEDTPELDIFYEPDMKNFEYYDSDGTPIGMYIIYRNDKKNVVCGRNYYIYKQQRTKGWGLNCILSCINYSFQLYPDIDIFCWSTHVGNKVMDRICSKIYEKTRTETNNPNIFGFNEQPPSELHSVTRKYMENFNKKYPKGFKRFKI